MPSFTFAYRPARSRLRLAVLAGLLTGLAYLGRADATCSACLPPPTAKALETEAVAAPVGHPLRGVIEKVMAERSALLVRHEEIPGVMRAMTMLLKVDAATLAAARENQTITATLVRLEDGWWLREVRAVETTATITP